MNPGKISGFVETLSKKNWRGWHFISLNQSWKICPLEKLQPQWSWRFFSAITLYPCRMLRAQDQEFRVRLQFCNWYFESTIDTYKSIAKPSIINKLINGRMNVSHKDFETDSKWYFLNSHLQVIRFSFIILSATILEETCTVYEIGKSDWPLRCTSASIRKK